MKATGPAYAEATSEAAGKGKVERERKAMQAGSDLSGGLGLKTCYFKSAITQRFHLGDLSIRKSHNSCSIRHLVGLRYQSVFSHLAIYRLDNVPFYQRGSFQEFE